MRCRRHGASCETIEGLSDSGEIADLQEAFRDRNALQCGYCTPGMLMAAQDLLKQNPTPSREEIREHLSGNYCRCTGYQAIIDAVEAPRNARRGRAMTEASAKPEALSVLDRPNSYIGKTVPRPNLDRLMQGRGHYVSDMELPRMAHVVFLRSPHAHARIVWHRCDGGEGKCPASSLSSPDRNLPPSSRPGSACSRI